MVRDIEDNIEDKKNLRPLDEYDIALLKTYGLGPCSAPDKKVGKEIKEINDLCGIKESDIGLAPPIQWDHRKVEFGLPDLESRTQIFNDVFSVQVPDENKRSDIVKEDLVKNADEITEAQHLGNVTIDLVKEAADAQTDIVEEHSAREHNDKIKQSNMDIVTNEVVKQAEEVIDESLLRLEADLDKQTAEIEKQTAEMEEELRQLTLEQKQLEWEQKQKEKKEARKAAEEEKKKKAAEEEEKKKAAEEEKKKKAAAAGRGRGRGRGRGKGKGKGKK